jgi:hypothetical protein
MTRIRYSFVAPGLVISTKTFSVGEDTVHLHLDLNEFFYSIQSLEGKLLANGSIETKNHATLKKVAKQALIDLGYTFNSETRNLETASITTNPTLVAVSASANG